MIAFNYFGHIVIGILIGLVLAKTPVDMAILVLASLLPDIDTPHSTYGKYNPFAKWMQHRGFTHTFGGSLLVSLPFVILGWKVFMLVYVACIGHILGDWLIGLLPTRQSLPLRLF